MWPLEPSSQKVNSDFMKLRFGFDRHYDNQAALELQTKNRRREKIGNVLFCQS